MKNGHTIPVSFLLVFPAVIRRVQVDTLLFPPLGFNLSQGGEDQLPSPRGGSQGGREGRREGAHGWLHLFLGWRCWRPKIFTENTGVPYTSLPLSEKAGVGPRGIAQQNSGEEIDLMDASLLHHLHFLFPSCVYFSLDVLLCC